MEVRLVIFDLDGVVVNTDEFHFMAWKQVLLNKWGICHTRGAEDLTKGIPRYTCMELLAKHYHIAATPQELHRTADEKTQSIKNCCEPYFPSNKLCLGSWKPSNFFRSTIYL